ncbi:MAG: hypothetical protein II178_04825 [Selenomonadaceae bacterium]|nr:hypothetical protein [Selenomonadaceae bacterium]
MRTTGSLKSMRMTLAALFAFGCMSACPVAHAWTDQAHMAIARAAGLKSYHNACAPDVTKHVMNINNYKQTASEAHFYDSAAPITKEDVYKQLEMMETHKDMKDGYVLGAILHTIRVSKELTEKGQFDEYKYDILAHYIGDMVQPLHMTAYDAFNKKWHIKTDSIMDYPNVKWDVDGAVKLSKEFKVDDSLSFKSEDEIIDYLVVIANESYSKAEELRKENRMLTRKEALERASRGASFLRAVLRYCGKEAVF